MASSSQEPPPQQPPQAWGLGAVPPPGSRSRRDDLLEPPTWAAECGEALDAFLSRCIAGGLVDPSSVVRQLASSSTLPPEGGGARGGGGFRCSPSDFEQLLKELAELLEVAVGAAIPLAPRSRGEAARQTSGGGICEMVAAGRHRPEPPPEDAWRLIEQCRLVAEALAWGEHFDPSLFDLFCERRLLPGLVAALCAPRVPAAAKVQLLQTLSMMSQNVRHETSWYYLLSGGHLSKLFDRGVGGADEELTAWLVSFEKSLALRLDANTVTLCIDRATGRFPLFESLAKHAVHGDQMVRTSARTALLTLLRRCTGGEAQAAAAEHAREVLAPRLAAAVGSAWAEALRGLRHRGASTVAGALEAEEDLLGFAGELAKLAIPRLSEALADSLVVGGLLPLLLTGLAGVDSLGSGGGGSSSSGSSSGGRDEPKGRSSACDPAPSATSSTRGPETSLALHAVAASLRALGAVGCFAEPLALLLLARRLPRPPPAADGTSPGGDLAALIVGLEVEGGGATARRWLASVTRLCGCSSGRGLTDEECMKNPFRDGLLATDVAATPLLAWVLRELVVSDAVPSEVLEGAGLLPRRASVPLLQPASALHATSPLLVVLAALRPEQGLAREAQGLVLAAVVDLCAQPRAQAAGLPAALARAVASEVAHAAELLSAAAGIAPRRASDGATDDAPESGAGGALGGAVALASFLEEWEWHEGQQPGGRADWACRCGGPEALRSAAGEDVGGDLAGHTANGPSARLAARSFLALLRLRAALAQLRSGRRLEDTAPNSMPPCPLRVHPGWSRSNGALGRARKTVPGDGSSSAAEGAGRFAGEIGCLLESERTAVRLLLHLELFVLALGPPSEEEEEEKGLLRPEGRGEAHVQSPIWQARAAADARDGGLLHIVVVVARPPAAGSGGCSGRRLRLRFAHEEDRDRALRHVEVCAACELSRVRSELDSFIKACCLQDAGTLPSSRDLLAMMSTGLSRCALLCCSL